MRTQSASVDREHSPFGPRLATTYEGGDPAFLEKMVPLVDYVEVVPDSISTSINGKRSISKETLAELKEICQDVPIIAHGVGLSIGSHEGYSEGYLRLLDQLLEHVDITWHSEHLGYTTVDGVHLGTMLPMPLTDQALDVICERVHTVQQRYRIPFLLENVAHVLPTFSSHYRFAEFMNILAARAGCYLLLDIYNLECDAHNHGLDIKAFIGELNLDAVWEVHVAHGVEHKRLRLDVHSDVTRESTLILAREVLSRSSSVHAITYELLSQAVPVLGHSAVANELMRIRSHVLVGQ